MIGFLVLMVIHINPLIINKIAQVEYLADGVYNIS